MRRKIIIKTNKEAQVPVEALYSLFQESFRQWSDNGIDSPFLHKTLEEFDRVIETLASISGTRLSLWHMMLKRESCWQCTH